MMPQSKGACDGSPEQSARKVRLRKLADFSAVSQSRVHRTCKGPKSSLALQFTWPVCPRSAWPDAARSPPIRTEIRLGCWPPACLACAPGSDTDLPVSSESEPRNEDEEMS